jgi:hypothetical protein
MAYLKRLLKGRYEYLYIVRSERKGNRVIPRVLEYLGRDPDPKRLKRALAYWHVKETRRRPR